MKKFKADNFEITSLTGNISQMKGQPYLHCHITLADSKYQVFGGHLEAATVSATFEGWIRTSQTKIERATDPQTGLNLLDLDC